MRSKHSWILHVLLWSLIANATPLLGQRFDHTGGPSYFSPGCLTEYNGTTCEVKNFDSTVAEADYCLALNGSITLVKYYAADDSPTLAHQCGANTCCKTHAVSGGIDCNDWCQQIGMPMGKCEAAESITCPTAVRNSGSVTPLGIIIYGGKCECSSTNQADKAADKIVFTQFNDLTLTDPPKMMGKKKCGTLTVMLKEGNGGKIPKKPAEVKVFSLENGGFEFFSTTTCTGAKTDSVSISGISSKAFGVRGTGAPKKIYPVKAVLPGLGSASMNINYSPAVAVNFVNPPMVGPYLTTCGAATLESRDEGNIVAQVNQDVVINLSASPNTGSFFSDPICSTPIISVKILENQSTASFFYKASSPGNPILNAIPADDLLDGASQQESFSPSEYFPPPMVCGYGGSCTGSDLTEAAFQSTCLTHPNMIYSVIQCDNSPSVPGDKSCMTRTCPPPTYTCAQHGSCTGGEMTQQQFTDQCLVTPNAPLRVVTCDNSTAIPDDKACEMRTCPAPNYQCPQHGNCYGGELSESQFQSQCLTTPGAPFTVVTCNNPAIQGDKSCEMRTCPMPNYQCPQHGTCYGGEISESEFFSQCPTTPGMMRTVKTCDNPAIAGDSSCQMRMCP